MDQYTKKTQEWLEHEFSKFDEKGRYISHQPIYGFGKSLDGRLNIPAYALFYQFLATLNTISFSSFLDVGGAQGFYPFLVRHFFKKVRVRNSDLSQEVCNWGEKILGIKSDCVDVQNLPYKNNSFDVVFCSETLEHVKDDKRALSELLRIAKKAVILTVPFEPAEVVTYNIQSKTPHGHIHTFSHGSFDYLKHQGLSVKVRKTQNVLMYIPDKLLFTEPIGYYVGRYPRIVFVIYNQMLSVLQSAFLKKIWRAVFSSYFVVKTMIFLDPIFSNFFFFHTLFFVITKDSKKKKSKKTVSLNEILNVGVPYYEKKVEKKR